MTYNDFIKKQTSDKRVILEIQKGFQYHNQYWSVFEPGGIYRTTISNFERSQDYSFGRGAYGYFPYGSGGSGVLLEAYTGFNNVSIVGALAINVIQYQRASTLQNMRITPNSFWWDFDNQILYTNSNVNPNFADSVVVSETFGYANKEGEYGGAFYDGRIKSIPEMTSTKDPLFFGLISFDEGQIILDNKDGLFDNFEELDIYGQPVELKFGFSDLDYADWAVVYTGYFESFLRNDKTFTIKMRDPRKNISTSIPENVFSTSQYANIDGGNVGEVIPLGYGLINKQLAMCTNESATVSTYNFKFCDTTNHLIQSVDKVYVDGIEVAFTNASTSGTFDLSASVYEPGQDVTVSYTGFDISNPLDIIVDLLETYTDIAYTIDSFDQVEWEATRALVPDIGLAIIESKTIVDIIGEISTTVQGLFMFKPDGKITFRLRDLDKLSVTTIEVGDQLLPTRDVSKAEEYTSKVRVGYNRAWSNEKHSYIIDDSQEQTLFNRFRRKKTREFKTLLTNATDAQTFADNIYDEFAGVFPTFTFTTSTKYINLLLEDNINAYRYYGLNRAKLFKLEVIGINLNLLKGEMKITGRFLNELPLPENFMIS